ncbi:MAG TPA: hypothetical protein VN653_18395 [Anaerolineales bacterium]|nr:hypothetical protein [Anaerolineales bacterium]
MANDSLLNLIRLLLLRLERISADSYWAHRASGVRGALLRTVEDFENQRPVSRSKLDTLIQMGFTILEASIKDKQT